MFCFMSILFNLCQHAALYKPENKNSEMYWETQSIVAMQRRYRTCLRTSTAPCARMVLRLQKKFIGKGTVKNENKGQSGSKKKMEESKKR